MLSYSTRNTLAVLTLFLLSTSAFAQETQLPEVVIFANQAPLEANRVGSAVTVLSGDTMRENNLRTLGEALRTVPGVSINRSGSRGSATELRMRGAEANHILVLIDGVEVNSIADNGFDFADFPIDDIERVEVIRGPQSGLYGSNAHAGVVSVVTLSGKGLKGPRMDARLEGGSMHTFDGALNVRNAVGPVYGSLTVSGYESGGYNIAQNGSERDRSRAFTGTGKFGIDFNEFFSMDAVVRYTTREASSDFQDFASGSPTYGLLLDGRQRTDRETLSTRVGAVLKLFDGRWIQSVNAKYFDDKVSSFENGSFGFSAATLSGTREAYDYKSTVLFDTNLMGGEKHTFSILTDHRKEDYTASFLSGASFEKKRLGVAAEYVIDLPTLTTFSAAVRHDWNDPFKDALTWRFALSQRIPSTASRLHASIGKGITDPDHTEVLGFPVFSILPNPNLKPESSIGWDVGIEQTFWGGKLVTDVTYFSVRFQDKIEASFIGFDTQYVNAPGTAHRDGVEFAATWKPTGLFSFTGSYTYLVARNAAGDAEFRRPPHAGSVEATLHSPDGRAHFTLGASYNDTRRDVRFNDFPTPNSFARLPSTTVAWASFNYDVNKQTTAYVRVENLFNHQYEEIFSYRAPPFAAFAGLKIKLGDR